MPNDSASGGPLASAGAPAPLEGQALNDFLQQWIVGITGLDGTMVRPRWQAEPANIPDSGVAWAALGITTRSADAFPAVVHDGTGEGTDQLQRHEQLTVLCSFYDTGVNGQADKLATLLRDGTAIAQNREILTIAGMNLVSVGEAIAVPSLLKQTWLYRVDLPVVIRRIILRSYAVLNVESAVGVLSADDGQTRAIQATAP
jgi:hypothetical protein